MHSVAGCLATGVQAGYGGLSIAAGPNSAHDVVGGGGDRDVTLAQIQVIFPAGAADVGKPGLAPFLVQMRNVQQNVVGLSRLHLPDNCPSDHVPGGQLGHLVVPGHEALPFEVPQYCALATHSLRD